MIVGSTSGLETTADVELSGCRAALVTGIVPNGSTGDDADASIDVLINFLSGQVNPGRGAACSQ
ncbi:hypothetical protein Lesp01_25850 [Lentzea sp. NBRC 102530]|nr:hypothetical protein Lesp01_25850 [Lentzea sp. NBRC 102530]